MNYLDELLSFYNTSAHSVLQYFSNFICINSLEFMSPDNLSWWKAGWVCFYSCICCDRKWGRNLICPGDWKAFQRIDGSTKKAVGFCQEGTAQEMLWAEVSADPSFSVTGPGMAASVTTIRKLNCSTPPENTAIFSLLAILSTNALQKVCGRSCKSKCRRVSWTCILYKNSWSPIKALTKKECSSPNYVVHTDFRTTSCRRRQVQVLRSYGLRRIM